MRFLQIRNKFSVTVLALFFILVIKIYLLSLYYYAQHYNGWIIGDWLVNYRAGFVRRGLGGYLILHFSSLLNIKANLSVYLIQSFLSISYLFILFILIFRKTLNFFYVILLLSPGTLLFPILDTDALGRKEIILFFLFGLFIFLLQRNLLKSYLAIFICAFVLFTATLFHELFFFYTPYFILAAYVKSKINKESFSLLKVLLLISGTFPAMIIIYFFGAQINSSVICSSLLEQGLPGDICSGVLSWSDKLDVTRFAGENGYLVNYGISFLTGFFPFVLFVKFGKSNILELKTFLLLFLIIFLFSLPLFVLSIDWGRWINIHFVLLLFTFSMFLSDESSGSSGFSQSENFNYPGFVRTNYALSGSLSFLICSLIIISYASCWYMAHYGNFHVFSFNFYYLLKEFFSWQASPIYLDC